MDILIKVKRYNGTSNWIESYNLSMEKDISILQLLNKIKNENDSSLAFPVECRQGICGGCAVKVNGKECLSCKTRVKDIIKNDNYEIMLEPIENFKVIKDLIIDFSFKDEKLIKSEAWNDDKKIEITHKKQEYEKSLDCIMCGICSSVCPVLKRDKEYLDPYILNKVYRINLNEQNNKKQLNLHIIGENGLLKCLKCRRCTRMCPKGIDVTANIIKLKEMSDELILSNK